MSIVGIHLCTEPTLDFYVDFYTDVYCKWGFDE